MHCHGAPEIFNTDSGCQFTSEEFTGLLMQHHLATSMDGTGCSRDHVFVEQRWRSVAYKEVRLHSMPAWNDT